MKFDSSYMNQIKILLLVAFCLALLSCNRHLTTVYFNDTSRVDDGEIFGEGLSSFFVPDEHIYVQKMRSTGLEKELKKVTDSLSLTEVNLELDDGYYGYAFITSSKDTLFADYNLSFWKIKKKGLSLANEKLRSIIQPLFKK